MKNRLFLSLFLVFGLFAFRPKPSTVSIKGKFIGEIPKKLEYSSNIEGRSFAGFRNSVEPDSLGNFEIIVPLKKPEVFSFVVFGRMHKMLILEPDTDYKIDFRLSEKSREMEIISGPKRFLELYTRLEKPISIQQPARDYVNDADLKESLNRLANKRDLEMEEFKLLLDQDSISEETFELVQTDRACYYSTVMGTIFFLKYINQDNSLSEQDYALWRNIFERNPVDSNFLKSHWWENYVENYLAYRRCSSPSFDIENMLDLYKQGKIHTFSVEEMENYLPESIQESYKAVYLHLAAIQKEFEKELITLFDSYQADYPESPYTKFIEPYIQPILQFHANAAEGFSDEMKFVDGSDQIASMEDLFQQFKGKKLYVDVWATWCGPCKEEFAKLPDLNQVLTEEGVEKLFISLDKDDRDEQWKDMIKYYNLEGHHIRVNKELDRDLRQLSLDVRGPLFGIPWYLLVNTKGQIVADEAPSPSNMEELKQGLTKM